eukprot:scaffold571_cov364-Prasinococcus_capsulatus_cf.AAC.22
MPRPSTGSRACAQRSAAAATAAAAAAAAPTAAAPARASASTCGRTRRWSRSCRPCAAGRASCSACRRRCTVRTPTSWTSASSTRGALQRRVALRCVELRCVALRRAALRCVALRRGPDETRARGGAAGCRSSSARSPARARRRCRWWTSSRRWAGGRSGGPS